MAEPQKRVLGLLGHPGESDRPKAISAFAVGYNTVGLTIFGCLMIVLAIAMTIALRPVALLLWGMCAASAYLWYVRRRYHAPQRAWLEGSVLTVENGFGSRTCDMALAREVSLGYTVTANGAEPSFRVLKARDSLTAEKVHLVLRTDADTPYRAEDLLLLADAIEASPRREPADREAKAVAAALREIARYGREQTWADRVDWSHRTDQPGAGGS